MRIGFAGIGLMGLPLCRRLLAAGHRLTIWNRSPAACAPLLAEGARQAESPATLATGSDILMLCVSDASAVRAVCDGPHGVLAGCHDGLVVVDHSSIDPATTRELAAALAQRGGHWVDAPVSGGVAGAEQGRLVIMAGGSAADIDRISPVLQAYALRITHMGDTGAGQVTKICNQLVVAANSLLIAETVALAEQAGVDARLLAPALAGGFADSLPFQILAPRMAERRFEPVQWRVQTLLKDLDNALALAQADGQPVPLAAHAAALMRQHAECGHARADLSSVILLHRPQND